MAPIGTQRQVPCDAFGGTAHCAFEPDEAAGQHRVVSDHGIDPRHADIGAHGPLILLGDMEILHNRPEHLPGQLLRFAIAHTHERLLHVVGQGRRSEPVGLVDRFFEQCFGDPAPERRVHECVSEPAGCISHLQSPGQWRLLLGRRCRDPAYIGELHRNPRATVH